MQGVIPKKADFPGYFATVTSESGKTHRIQVFLGDITTLDVDAIVNAANT